MRTLLLFSLTFLQVNGITQIDSTWTEYVNYDYNFAFWYPNGWIKAPGTGAQTIYVENDIENKENANKPILWITSNFYVDVQNLKQKKLKKIGNEYEDLIAKNVFFENSEIISRKRIQFRTFEALEFIGTANVMTLTFKWQIIIFQTDEYYFELCSTAQKDTFDETYRTISDIFNSFNFVKN